MAAVALDVGAEGRDVLRAVAHRPGDHGDRLVALGGMHLAHLDAPEIELGAGFPILCPGEPGSLVGIDHATNFSHITRQAVPVAIVR